MSWLHLLTEAISEPEAKPRPNFINRDLGDGSTAYFVDRIPTYVAGNIGLNLRASFWIGDPHPGWIRGFNQLCFRHTIFWSLLPQVSLPFEY